MGWIVPLNSTFLAISTRLTTKSQSHSSPDQSGLVLSTVNEVRRISRGTVARSRGHDHPLWRLPRHGHLHNGSSQSRYTSYRVHRLENRQTQLKQSCWRNRVRHVQVGVRCHPIIQHDVPSAIFGRPAIPHCRRGRLLDMRDTVIHCQATLQEIFATAIYSSWLLIGATRQNCGNELILMGHDYWLCERNTLAVASIKSPIRPTARNRAEKLTDRLN